MIEAWLATHKNITCHANDAIVALHGNLEEEKNPFSFFIGL
jgi:hypothetical protein